MIELKSRNIELKDNTITEEEPAKIVLPTYESQSEFHMRAILGNQYKGNDLKTNVTAMLNKISGSYPERLIDHCVRWIEKENKSGPGYAYFYHGCSSKFAFIYDVYTAIYQHLQADEEWQALRGWNEPFTQFANIVDFIKHYSNLRSDHDVYDKSPGYSDAAICTNYFLFGNAHHLGECAIDYFLSNRTSRPFDLSKLLRYLVSEADMPDVLVEQLLQIYNKYYADTNGMLCQIQVPVADADQFSYASGACGVLNPYKNTIKLSEIFELLKQDLATGDPKNIETATDYIASLQARLMVPPHIKINVDHISYSQLSNPNHAQKIISDPQILSEIIYETIINAEADAFHPSVAYKRILSECLKRNAVMQEKNISLRALKTAYDAGRIDLIVAYVKKKPELAERVLGLSILDCDAKIAAGILDIYPDLKNKNITFSMSYFEHIPANSIPLYEAIMKCECPDEMMIACYGKNWMHSLPTGMHHNYQSLLMALRSIPENDRYLYAMQFLPKLKDPVLRFDKILSLLPTNLRAQFILDFLDNYFLDEESLNSIFSSVTHYPNLIDDKLKFLTTLLEKKSNCLPFIWLFFDMLENIESTAKFDLIKKYFALRPNCLCDQEQEDIHETIFEGLLQRPYGLSEQSEKKAFVEYVLTLPNISSQVAKQAQEWLIKFESKNSKNILKQQQYLQIQFFNPYRQNPGQVPDEINSTKCFTKSL